MKNRTVHFSLTPKASAALLFLWIVFATLLLGCGARHQTDVEMIRHFQAHRDQFSELLGMVRADRDVTFLRVEGTSAQLLPDGVLDEARQRDYRRLLSSVGLEGLRVFSSSANRTEVWFFTSIEGMRRSTFKHYAYVEQPQTAIVADLDQEGSKGTRSRKIDDSWYLALDDPD